MMKPGLVILLSLCFLSAITAAVLPDTVVVQKSIPESNKDEEKQVILANISEDCHQPKEIGRCFALFHRYAFNVETLKCEEFIYGGCSGNENNFETLEDCESKCLKIEKNTETNENPSVTENTKSVN